MSPLRRTSYADLSPPREERRHWPLLVLGLLVVLALCFAAVGLPGKAHVAVTVSRSGGPVAAGGSTAAPIGGTVVVKQLGRTVQTVSVLPATAATLALRPGLYQLTVRG